MKRIFLMACMTMTMLTACADNKTGFRLKVTAKQPADTLIVAYRPDGNLVSDTLVSKKGKFEVVIPITEPINVTVATPAVYRREADNFISLLGMPGETAEVEYYADHNILSGSKFYKDYNQLNEMKAAAIKPLQDLVADLMLRQKNGDNQEAVMKDYYEKMPPLREAYGQAIREFVKNNPDNEAAATLISECDNLEDMQEFVGMLSEKVRNGRMKPVLERPMAAAKERAEKEAAAAAKQAAGAQSTDFTLNDINGKPFTLSSLRGKYVLLDFWGSWCGWCIKGMPKMKEYYTKYAGKFEIIGIDCNDTPDKWKAAVEKHELPWIHVRNQDGGPNVCTEYGITGFPTKILVGPDGVIIKTVAGEDPAFYDFLDETFGK